MEITIITPGLELTLNMRREKVNALVNWAMELVDAPFTEGIATADARLRNDTKVLGAEAAAPRDDAALAAMYSGRAPGEVPSPGSPINAGAGAAREDGGADEAAGKTGSRVERLFGPKESWGAAGEQCEKTALPPTSLRGSRTERQPLSQPDRLPAPLTQGSHGGCAAAGEEDITMEKVMATLEGKQKMYRGFLYIRCAGCGEVRGYSAKKLITESLCRCGHKTPLRNLRKLEYTCGCCNTTWRYQTNLTRSEFEMECLSCKAPNTLVLNPRKNCYEGLA